MFLLAIALPTVLVGTLFTVTSLRRPVLRNRDKLLEALRVVGHVILWGALAATAIDWLLPSAWS